MKRQLQRLTAKAVEQQKRAGYWCDGGGLYLQVTATRSKSWIFRYARNGKAREMGLGSVQTVGLADARRKAADARRLLAEGIDPLDAKKSKKQQDAVSAARTITFNKCAESYIKAHTPKWKNAKHAGQWTSTIETYAAPVIGNLPVQDINTGLVLQVLEPIWNEKTETASRLRSRLEQVLDYAAVRGYRSGDNPARWRGHLAKLLPAIQKRLRVKHHPALPYSDVSTFMESLRAQEGTAARALEFVVLSACRTSEVLNAKPEEFDLKKGIWTIPQERMKAGREHRVPLSPRAIEIVKSQPDGEYLFQGLKKGKALSNTSMLMLLRRMKRSDLTVHGFRSSFRDWCAEQTNYPREVAEMALAHVIANQAEAAYRRGDLFEKRRRLMSEWSKYCEQRDKGGKVLKIAKLRGKGAA
jgi:integrase